MIAQFKRIRERTRTLFSVPADDAYYDRPIPLRNPIVFYDGHLPVFAINTLVKLARREKGIDERFETLFARGIDPEDERAVGEMVWPSREEVAAYAREAESRIERTLAELDGDDEIQQEAAANILEHELMHQETFAYMLHALPYEKKREQFGQRAVSPTPGTDGPSAEDDGARRARIAGGSATLGTAASVFGWDNEFPQHHVDVDDFEIDRFNVTNGEYLAYVEATGSNAPHFWTRAGDRWFWRGMFGLVPLPLDWPVYVTHDEATAFARWKGARLPSEAEWHRAAEGIDWGTPKGNVDFRSWNPVPVGCGERSAHGVFDLASNGWEWTSTTFAGFDGFRPMRTYPAYSADFFDGRHFVLKGASPVTPRELVRPAFRNWFRPNYPWVFATFRCVR